MAQKAVEIGYDCMNGKKPKEALTLIPVELITKKMSIITKGGPSKRAADSGTASNRPRASLAYGNQAAADVGP